MRNNGLGSWPARRARKTPGRVAVEYRPDGLPAPDGDPAAPFRLTYAQLHDRVARLARGLRELGVRAGDRVAFLGPNHPAFLETLFATGLLGAVFVPVNFRLSAPEAGYLLADSGAAVLVYAPGQQGLVDALPAAGPGAAGPVLVSLAAGVPGAHDYARLLATPPGDPIDEPVDAGDPCMIMYTSGTTGHPKGAVLTHRNITVNCVNVLIDVDLAADERTLVVAPLFHTAGLNMTCLPTVLKGGRVVLLPAFDPGTVLELIESAGITYLFGVPTMYDAMAAHPRWPATDLSGLRHLNCGGAPVPDRTIATYLARGLAFSQGYGMTEAAPGVLYLAADVVGDKPGSAGVPHFFTDVAIVAPDGTPAGPGGTGEVRVSGPNVMTGYWNRPADTAQALPDDGWLRSGDLARVDADGYAYIVDRLKDLIISGGENIYPAEVESAILDHPSVADCAVIGVPDDRWGEVGRALVVPRPGSPADAVAGAAILAWLDGRLARYKIPRSVRIVRELPRTASGKIRKAELRRSHGGPD